MTHIIYVKGFRTVPSMYLKVVLQLVIVAYAFNPSIQETEADIHLCEFEAGLVYIVSSRIVRTPKRKKKLFYFLTKFVRARLESKWINL